MNAEHLLSQLGDRPLQDIPLSNLTPLLQRLGAMVPIHDLVPFIRNDQLAERLARCIMGGGLELTPQEIQVGELLGWENFLTAGMVHFLWHGPTSAPIPNRDICVAMINHLADYAQKNTDQLAKDAVGQINPTDVWKVVYLTPTPHNILNSSQVRVMVDDQLWQGVALPAHATIIQPGYYLVNFAPLDEKDWGMQELIRARTQAYRMNAEMLVQAHLSHFRLRGYFPLFSDAHTMHHWAHDSDDGSIFIRRNGDKWSGRLEVRKYHTPGPHRLRNVGMNICYQCA
ncbi:MAG: hypothetical protein V4481_02210 [Patescibacteria group bacterium]